MAKMRLKQVWLSTWVQFFYFFMIIKKRKYHYIYTSEITSSIFAALKFVCSQIVRKFAAENKKITIMTQILVTLNEDATTQHVRKAIELLRGVVSTTVFKTKDESNKKTLRQQTYVKESLERAFDEMKQARREGRKLQSADDFIKELEAEEAVWKLKLY